MNYHEMSDFEINTEVAKIVTDGDVICADNMCTAPSKNGVQVIYEVGVHGEFYDYCNNPSDAFPIIVENNINLEWFIDNEGVYASASVSIEFIGTTSFLSDHENPLRAAMICFLKIKNQ